MMGVGGVDGKVCVEVWPGLQGTLSGVYVESLCVLFISIVSFLSD